MLRSIWSRLRPWVEANESFALATVTAVEGSGPRAAGACMAISANGKRFIGSASSGCLDAVVVEAAKEVSAAGGVRRLRFGPDDEGQPWSDGLTCGGWIDVCVEPWWGCHANEKFHDIGAQVRGWLENDDTGVVVGQGAGHAAFRADGAFLTGDQTLADEVSGEVRRALELGLPSHAIPGDPDPVFLHMLHRRPRLVMIGGVDVAGHLVALAREIGFATTIVDPRAAFVAPERFPNPPDAIFRAWPGGALEQLGFGPRDAAVTLTHDPKIDDQALLALLKTKVGYIGALGSKRSHAARLDRLGETVSEKTALDRIEGPAGIHLGAGSAAGIALGIMAGIVRWSAARDREALAMAAHV